MSCRSLLPIVVGILFSTSALADQAEWYLVPTVAPELMRLREPTRGASLTTRPSVGLGLSAMYGVTNSLHLGAQLHFASLSNVPFTGTQMTLRDGSTPTGTLYANDSVYALTATATYRVLVPSHFAPIFSIGAGPVLGRYTSLALYPSATQVFINRPDQREVGFVVEGRTGIDYRFGNHLSVSLAFEIRWNVGLQVPWEFAAPISIGYIW
jgi:hypothetical protein